MKASLLIYVAILVAACQSGTDIPVESRPHVLTRRLELLASPPFADCGHAGERAASQVVACVERALSKGQPFIASFPVQGIDSRIVLGLVFSESGRATRLTYDSDPGGGHAAGITNAESCPTPELVLGERWVSLSCSRKAPEPLPLIGME